MKAISINGKYKTTVEAPKNATKKELEKKARKYIKTGHKIID